MKIKIVEHFMEYLKCIKYFSIVVIFFKNKFYFYV